MREHTIYKSVEGKKLITEHYENYLQTLGLDVERIFVDTSFGKTHMLVAGPIEGKPLFILQGGNCINPMTLSWFLPLLNQYRIYAPDTIGHPGFSDETRVSAQDDSFAKWITELMDHFKVEKSAFIGPSYGAGIILRLATFMPDKISCAILVSPAGIKLGSKLKMIKEVLVPMVLFNVTNSKKHLTTLTNNMSENSMKDKDRQIIGDIFKNVKLEQDMPKLTEKKELVDYKAPTLIIAGKKDIFFPENKMKRIVQEIIPNLIAFKTFDMGHFPSEKDLIEVNKEILDFLSDYY